MGDAALEAFWREHVDAFRVQGGSQQDYCREHGIKPRQLRRWRTRLYGPMRAPRPSREGGSLRRSSNGTLASENQPDTAVRRTLTGRPVLRRRLTDKQRRELLSPGMIEIELPGGRYIRVWADVDVDALRRVLSVLEAPA